MGELLSVKNINVYYGSIHAIKDVSFHVDEGEIVTLIGANGAGKTTTMHAISGLLKLASGEITYDGNLISKMEAHKIVRLGLAQVPEGRRVFSGLTVQQNLSMGAYTRHDGKDAIQSDYDMVFDLLPRLKERRNQPAGTLVPKRISGVCRKKGAILRHMCIRMRFFHLRDFMAVRILHSSRSLASLCDVTDNTCTIAN